MKESFYIFLGGLIFVGILALSFYIKRYVNYSFYYEDKIQEQIEPLEERIKILEKRQNMLLRLLNHD